MLYRLVAGGPLRDPAEPSAGGGNGAPAGGNGAGAGTPTPGGGFDPAAFRTEIMNEFNKTLNGFAKNLKTDFAKMIPQQAQPATAAVGQDPDPAAGNGNGAGNNGNAQMTPEMRQLANELARFRREAETQKTELQKLREENNAEKQKRLEAQRDRTITEAWAGTNWASSVLAKDALKLIVPELQWTEDGQLVGPNGTTPAEEYAREWLAARPHYLKPVDAGSAGARAAQGQNGRRAWSLDDLEPSKFKSLTPQQQKELQDFVASMYGTAQQTG